MMLDYKQLEHFHRQAYGNPWAVERLVKNAPRFIEEWTAMAERKPQSADQGGKVTTEGVKTPTFGPSEPVNLHALDAAILEARSLDALLKKCMERNLCYIQFCRKDWTNPLALRAVANTLLSVRDRIAEDPELRDVLALWDRSIRFESQKIFKDEAWWTPDEAASAVGVTRETIMQWATEGDASCMTVRWKPDRMNDQSILVDRSSVVARNHTEAHLRKVAQRERMRKINMRRSSRLKGGV